MTPEGSTAVGRRERGTLVLTVGVGLVCAILCAACFVATYAGFVSAVRWRAEALEERLQAWMIGFDPASASFATLDQAERFPARQSFFLASAPRQNSVGDRAHPDALALAVLGLAVFGAHVLIMLLADHLTRSRLRRQTLRTAFQDARSAPRSMLTTALPLAGGLGALCAGAWCAGLGSAANTWAYSWPLPWPPTALAIGAGVVFVVADFGLVWSRRWRRAVREIENAVVCRRCGYTIGSEAISICPECGTDRGDERGGGWWQPRRVRAAALLGRGIVALALVLVMLVVVTGGRAIEYLVVRGWGLDARHGTWVTPRILLDRPLVMRGGFGAAVVQVGKQADKRLRVRVLFWTDAKAYEAGGPGVRLAAPVRITGREMPRGNATVVMLTEDYSVATPAPGVTIWVSPRGDQAPTVWMSADLSSIRHADGLPVSAEDAAWLRGEVE